MPQILFLFEKFAPDIGRLATSSAHICKRLASTGFNVDVFVWSRFVQSGRIERETTDRPNLNVIRVVMYRQ
jgi:hypothetical protein